MPDTGYWIRCFHVKSSFNPKNPVQWITIVKKKKGVE